MMETLLAANLRRWSLACLVCATALSLPARAQDGLSSLLDEAERSAGASPGPGRPDRRQPAPSAAATKQAITEVKEIFRDDYAKATTPPAKLGLARQLLGQADKTTAAPEQWALFSEVMRLASDAGDIELSFAAIEKAGGLFAIDVDDLKLDAISKLATKAPLPALDGLARAALELAQRALAAGDAATSSKSLSLAAGLARKTKNRAMLAEVTKIQQSARDQEKESKELAAIKAKLASDPSNPDICLEAGKYFCFKAGDWARGLPLLAKGSDTDLARLAVADVNGSKTADAISALGDAWWDWAENQRGAMKAAGMGRAADHYRSIITQLQGLDRARLEKRIAAADAEDSGRGKRTPLADLDPVSQHAVAFGFKRDGTFMNSPYVCAGKQWPKALTVMPGGSTAAAITYNLPDNAKRLRGKAGVFLPQGSRAENGPRSPLEFEIVVDGRSAWKSPPLPKCHDTADFDIPLFGAQTLELRTSCKEGHAAWAAWLDPEIVE